MCLDENHLLRRVIKLVIFHELWLSNKILIVENVSEI